MGTTAAPRVELIRAFPPLHSIHCRSPNTFSVGVLYRPCYGTGWWDIVSLAGGW